MRNTIRSPPTSSSALLTPPSRVARPPAKIRALRASWVGCPASGDGASQPRPALATEDLARWIDRRARRALVFGRSRGRRRRNAASSGRGGLHLSIGRWCGRRCLRRGRGGGGGRIFVVLGGTAEFADGFIDRSADLRQPTFSEDDHNDENNYFFFQAEDGIRDPLVTGVQTCALSI